MGDSGAAEPNPILPFEYLDFADQFYKAFHELRERPAPLSWPRYFLLCHSIELALKAYLALFGTAPAELKYDFGHKLDELVDEAVAKGLSLTTTTQDAIKHLKEAHTELRHRYPAEKAKPVYIIEQFIPTARELLKAVSAAVRGPGLVTYD
jgi:HEPN domain-containing protein